MKILSFIGIRQENLKPYLKHYENPAGTKIINDLTALYFLWNSYGYYNKICLATHSFSLFFERNELLEVPLRKQVLSVTIIYILDLVNVIEYG